MACLRTSSYLHRPCSPLKFRSSFTSPFSSPLCCRRRPASLSFRYSSSSSRAAAAMAAAASTVEHVVLFKVRESTDPSKIDAMVSNLRSLVSLDLATHLSAGPVLRYRSADASAAGFTHLLHSRYRSKDDLATYSAHPAHVAVVKEFVLPICDDIMALDWVAELDGPAVLPPGSVVRLTLAKPKEGAITELMAKLAVVKQSAPAAVKQMSFGENFSPARAKGYGLGLIAVSALEELSPLGGQQGLVIVGEEIKAHLESFIETDFEVSPPPAANL